MELMSVSMHLKKKEVTFGSQLYKAIGSDSVGQLISSFHLKNYNIENVHKFSTYEHFLNLTVTF